MSVTLESLHQYLTDTVRHKNELVADLNAAIGQVDLLERLIREACAPVAGVIDPGTPGSMSRAAENPEQP